MQEREDSELLSEIKNGSHSAFAVLVRRHSMRFYSVAYRFLQSKAAAEDLVQEAFLKLWERPEMWNPERNVKFTTWFYRVVTNLSLDFLKKKSPLALLEGMDYADEREGAEESLMASQSQRRLEKEIAALPERQRVALNLCFYEGLTNQEAADVMRINLKALQSLLSRAKQNLQEKFQDQG